MKVLDLIALLKGLPRDAEIEVQTEAQVLEPIYDADFVPEVGRVVIFLE